MKIQIQIKRIFRYYNKIANYINKKLYNKICNN